MRCPEEGVLSQYADGELSKGESGELDSHLEACRACRERMADLKAENRLLAECLQAIDSVEAEAETLPGKRPEFSGIDRLAAGLIGIALLLRIGLGFLERAEIPSALQWLHPWSVSGLLNWTMNGLFFLLEEGGPFMTSLVETARNALLGLPALGFMALIARRALRAKSIVGLVALLFAVVVPGYAIDLRKPEKGMGGTISVAENETVNDTLVVFADSVNIGGTVTGDLIAFARNVDIQGSVQGNVFSFAQKIDIAGTVDGDVFVFGQSLRADGQVGKSLWGFGQTITLGRSARLNNDAVLFASNAYINGDVGRDAVVHAGTLDVRSRLARDLRFSGGALAVYRPSVIGRNLSSKTRSAQEAKIDPGVIVRGNKKLEFHEARPSRYRTLGFYSGQALRTGAMLLMGILFFWIAPRMRSSMMPAVRTMLASGGIGFLAAVSIPIAAIILALTVIGIPVALLFIALWLLGLYLAKIIIAQWIGTAILGIRDGGWASTLMPLLLGVLIVVLAINLPYIGSILNFILILVGLGALVKELYAMRRKVPSQNY